MLKKKKQNTLDISALETKLININAELTKVTESLEKIVYLNEYQFKSAGLNVKYPKKGDIK